MAAFTAIAAGIGLAMSAGGMAMQASQAKKNRDLAQDQANAADTRYRQQQAALERDKAAYKKMKFKNPYKDMQNVFEDLTVNQQQAQFEKQMGTQQRADILQQLRGAVGASGVAALAQSMANQGALQAQRVSASIGMQERANQMAAAKGESAADMAERGGEAMLQQMEVDRQATMLGMSAGGAAAAGAGVQQAYANQMAAAGAEAQAWGQIAQFGLSAAGTLGSMSQPTGTTTGFTPNPAVMNAKISYTPTITNLGPR